MEVFAHEIDTGRLGNIIIVIRRLKRKSCFRGDDPVMGGGVLRADRGNSRLSVPPPKRPARCGDSLCKYWESPR